MYAPEQYGGTTTAVTAAPPPVVQQSSQSAMREAAALRGGLNAHTTTAGSSGISAILNRATIVANTGQQAAGSVPKLPAVVNPSALPAVGPTPTWAWPRSAPAGYRNLGNTCFLASVLQLLGHTPALATLAHDQTHSRQCPLQSPNCALCVLEARIRATQLAGASNSQAPQDVLFCMRNSASLQSLTRGRQEDAHECLRLVLEALHHSGLRGMNCPVYGPDAAPGPHRAQTLVETLFGGRLLSRVTCCSCGGHSDTIDNFEDLSLELGQGTDSVLSALAGFTREERLDGADRYKCERCSALSDATKRISVARAPEVLVLHLKRFKSNAWGKNCSHVAFSQHLSMEPFMAAPTPTVDRMPPDAGAQHQAPAEIEATQEAPGQLNVGKYNLYAVIVHSGYGVHSGHYYAYVRDGLGRWYLCDDNIVRAVQESDVLRSEAYILAYMRAPPTQQATPQKPPAPHTAVGASTVPNEVEAGANNAPPSPPQIARSSGVAWNMVRKRVAGSGSHVDPGVVALGKSCDEYLQAVRPWTASVTETLRQTAATFRKQHGRPAGVEELVHAWEKEHKKRSWELLQCPQTTTVMDEWCDAAEQLLRKHARGEETIERDQSPGGPAI